ncbi:2Fe-2S iron-sulfur cluster binding domain-containing protein [Streptomyces sp. CB01635]|uniref:2Fe-2S iron-sulfur cluster-binding protein n=1 Tax=unclassified Streptomyces TaxID=2593676 RepID=UPI001F401712|nr:2Fe-2S iron-sulfur cluster binding domain-containing protein [Streptomyces sp. CB01635]
MERFTAGRPILTLTSERFTRRAPAAASTPVERAGFEVETRDGCLVTVAPDESVLDALDRAGVRTLSSCRQGTCGTCETPVLAGMPEHHDNLLTDQEHAENRTMLSCVSRSAGPRLTLDVRRSDVAASRRSVAARMCVLGKILRQWRGQEGTRSLVSA